MSELLTTETMRVLQAMRQPVEDVVRDMEAYGESHGPTTVGREVGQLFRLLTRFAAVDRVFEFGSGYGYSGYWFVSGGADVVLTDVDEAALDRARAFYKEAGIADRARFEAGDALDVLDRTAGPFDAVLIDYPKERYPDALAAVRDRLSPGALVIADNALVSTSIRLDDLGARLAGESPSLNASTAGVAQYLETVRDDPAFETSVLPLGEGVAVSRFDP